MAACFFEQGLPFAGLSHFTVACCEYTAQADQHHIVDKEGPGIERPVPEIFLLELNNRLGDLCLRFAACFCFHLIS